MYHFFCPHLDEPTETCMFFKCQLCKGINFSAMVGVGKKKTKTAARTAFDLAVKKGVPDSLIHQLYRSGALNLGVVIWDEWEFFFLKSSSVRCVYIYTSILLAGF